MSSDDFYCEWSTQRSPTQNEAEIKNGRPPQTETHVQSNIFCLLTLEKLAESLLPSGSLQGLTNCLVAYASGVRR